MMGWKSGRGMIGLGLGMMIDGVSAGAVEGELGEL